MRRGWKKTLVIPYQQEGEFQPFTRKNTDEIYLAHDSLYFIDGVIINYDICASGRKMVYFFHKFWAYTKSLVNWYRVNISLIRMETDRMTTSFT